ncbi:MAG: hypothetical protein II813_07115 [Spirochaetales bacterium]|nr:hypothetical protein [Spirochaetales bacterium]
MSRKGDIVIFAALIAVIVTGIMILHLPTFIPLMVCTVIVSLYAILFLKKNTAEILKAILGAAFRAPWPLLLAIGALIASWVQCGAVPYLVASGLRIINVRFFLPLVLLICTAMSAVTGSSWTTCGTLGIAFIGMSISLGIPIGMTLGAVLCGAFFGDKISRLSDFAVSTVSIAQADFSRHVRLMLYSAVPSLLISLVLFFFVGRSYAAKEADFSSINGIVVSLGDNFRLSVLTLIPLVVLVGSLLAKLPGIIPIVLSTVSAMVISLTVQGCSFLETLLPLLRGFSIQSGHDLVNSICNRGGMLSMVKIALLVIFAFTIGAILKKTDIMNTVASPVKRIVRGRLSLFAATYLISAVMAFTTGSGTIGVIVSYNVLSSFYDRFKVDHAFFTRTICEMITIQQPMVVWGSSGAFVAQCFGISASVYAPYYFIAFLLPLFGLLYAATGWGYGPKTGETA